MPLPSSLRPLRHRDFAILSSAGLVSHAGTWMQTVAVGALVAESTRSALWVAGVAVAQFLPLGVLSPIGGALADRVDRKRFMLVGYLALTLLATSLSVLVANDLADPPVVLLVVFLGGCVGSMVFPFQQAILPSLVPREDLVAAVSIGSAEYNMGRVVGPALAGILITATSSTWVFAVNATTFLVVFLAVAVIDVGPRPQPSGEGLLASVRAGARAAKGQPTIRTAIVGIGAAALLLSPFIGLLPAMAEELRPGAAEAELARVTGALTTSQGIGAVMGALLLAPLTARLGARRAVSAVVGLCAVALVLYASAPSVPLAVVAIFAVGAFYIGILNGLAAVVQLAAPDEYRGRVLSLFFVALGLVYPIGLMVHGGVAELIGLPETTAVMAGAMLVALTVTSFLRPTFLAPLDVVPAPVTPADREEVTAAAAAVTVTAPELDDPHVPLDAPGRAAVHPGVSDGEGTVP